MDAENQTWAVSPAPRQESHSGVSLDQVGLRTCLCGSECGQHRLQAVSWTVSEEKRQNKNKQRGCLLSPNCGGDVAGARSSVTAFDVPETMTLTQNSKPK